MTCREIEPYLVDVARGVTGSPSDEAEAARHLTACPRCGRLLEGERALSAALRRLAEEPTQPPDPAREAAILAAFDAVWARRRSGPADRRAWLPVAAAVLLAVGASGLWLNVTRRSRPAKGTSSVVTGAPPQNRPLTPPSESREASRTPSVGPVVRPAGAKSFARRQERIRRAGSADGPRTPEFVLWPGAAALSTFESGELVRLELPASVLPSLGLLPPASQTGVVQADVLIGQDGFARAIRLVP